MSRGAVWDRGGIQRPEPGPDSPLAKVLAVMRSTDRPTVVQIAQETGLHPDLAVAAMHWVTSVGWWPGQPRKPET